MSYKISGTKNRTARIIVIKQSDWNIEFNTVVSGSGDYEVAPVPPGDKLVIALNDDDGQSFSFANVTAEEYATSVGNRGVFTAGWTAYNLIQYITISIPSNAQDFGDLLEQKSACGNCSNAVNGRAVVGGGYIYSGGTRTNTIEYFDINSLGNASDFGNLSQGRSNLGAHSNGVNNRGTFSNGHVTAAVNTIDYITISSTGNAQDFGDLTEERRSTGSTDSGILDRAINAGGYDNDDHYSDVIDYFTISTTGNASDFGDLLRVTRESAACSNRSNDRCVMGPGTPDGNQMQYITMSSLGNASDFGDITISHRTLYDGTSNGEHNTGIWGPGILSGATNVIEQFTISTLGNATDFGDSLITTWNVSATSNA